MSILHHTHPLAQGADISQARHFAQLLTPEQRYILLRAGAPVWAGLRITWQPVTQIEVDLARQLASPVWGLLMPSPRDAHQYQLTPLGMQVVALGLAGILPFAEVH